MTSKELAAEAKTRLAELLPDASVAALDLYENGRNHYRLRLLGDDITKEVCVIAYTTEDVLKRFVRAVKKRVSELNNN
ncbi:hypothetical protein [Hymenobacter glacieicola]|uniref:Uncharacterized protein n=1 Tax=Hymenobacter glacieicola TaxID=1562124 RepID=A0ABQ1X9J3_9BACT|nr:hypothetical protein [Hymenobacter glacieicola]GGG60562.1 hypothetical protein GCM10011378_40740 [Hymenobacter glacieicola]